MQIQVSNTDSWFLFAAYDDVAWPRRPTLSWGIMSALVGSSVVSYMGFNFAFYCKVNIALS